MTEADTARLPGRPYLKPWYRVAYADNKVLFEYAQAAVVLEGRAAERFIPTLLPLLDGHHTVEDIAAFFGPENDSAVRSALITLESHGLLTNGPPVSSTDKTAEAALFLASTAPEVTSPDACLTALRAARIAVVGSGAAADEIERIAKAGGVDRTRLEESGQLREAATAFDLVIVAPTWDQRATADDVNKLALERSTAWMLVGGFDGRIAPVGPLFIPGETACYECLKLRLRVNSEYRDHAEALAKSAPPFPEMLSVVSMVAGLAVTLAARWLTWRDPFVPGLFYAFEYETVWDLTPHRVYRVPRCPACSPLTGLSSPSPWGDL